jgi:hypothetical protein
VDGIGIRDEFISAYAYSIEVSSAPKNHKEAMMHTDCDQWQEATTAEIKSLESHNTWSIVDRPRHTKLLTAAFIYKYKYDMNGNVEKHKARLVAHGYRQVLGVDYDNTYAPVAGATSIRMLLAIAAAENLLVHQMDIKTAFLYADLDEDIYLNAPPGISCPAGKVLKLNKSLYGLKQAPRNFNKDLNDHLVSLGFDKCPNDPCIIYIRRTEDAVTILAVYVDDIIIACSKLTSLCTFKAELASRYDMKDLEEMEWCLGIKLTHLSDGSLKLDQAKYCQDVLTRFERYVRPNHGRVHLPMAPGLRLLTEERHKLSVTDLAFIHNFPYREVVGSLMYLAVYTRPDIAYAVGQVAKFSNFPTKDSCAVCQQILEYLRDHPDDGLTFSKSNLGLEIIGYVDASNHDDTMTGSSSTGYIFFLGNSPICWKSKLQKGVVADSTAESEYVAAAQACKESLWIRMVMRFLGYDKNPLTPITLHEDCKPCTQIANNPMVHGRTKFIANKWHVIRQCILDRAVHLLLTPTLEQTADVFTKATPRAIFDNHKKRLLGVPTEAHWMHRMTSKFEKENPSTFKINADEAADLEKYLSTIDF